MNIASILAKKGDKAYTVRPDQPIREAPKVSMTLLKKVSGVPLPQLFGVTLIGVTFK